MPSKLTAKVEFYKGSTLTQTYTQDNSINSFTVTRAGVNGKFFGFGISQKSTLVLADLQRNITIDPASDFRYTLDNSSFCPYFDVESITRDEDNNTLTVVGNDIINKASKYVFKDLNLTAPYSTKDILDAIKTVLGCSFYHYPNKVYTYQSGANFSGTETLRQVLDFIAEITGTFYYVVSARNITFEDITLLSAFVEITKDDYFTFHTQQPVTLSKIASITELGDNIEAGDDTGAVQYIRNNPLLDLRDDRATILTSLLNRLGSLTFVPFDVEWSGNRFHDPGCKVKLTAENGSIVTTYLINETFNYDGTLEQTAEWSYSETDVEIDSNPATLGDALNQTFAKVDKLQKNITLYVSEAVDEVLPGKIDESLSGIRTDVADLKTTTSQNTQKITQLQLTTDGITSDVSTLQTTTTTLTNDLNDVVAEQTTIKNNISSLQQKDSEIVASVTALETTTKSYTDKAVENLQDYTDGEITSVRSSISQLSVKSDEIAASVEKVKSDTITTTDGLELKINEVNNRVDLSMTAEQVDIKISQAINNGVSSVTTNTGYTFDDEGLKISKSTSSMQSLLNETGLKVTSVGTTMLQATSEGVDARNLTAQEYLKIENVRFEKYNSTRMGCFWIGG